MIHKIPVRDEDKIMEDENEEIVSQVLHLFSPSWRKEKVL